MPPDKVDQMFWLVDGKEKLLERNEQDEWTADLPEHLGGENPRCMSS